MRAIDATVSCVALTAAQDAVTSIMAPLRALSSPVAPVDDECYLVGVSVVVVDGDKPLTGLQDLLHRHLHHVLFEGKARTRGNARKKR